MGGTFIEFKGKKEKYIDRIADSINAYICVNHKKPETIFLTSALFNVLSKGHTKKENLRFCGIKIEVYESQELKFHFVETEYVF